MSGPPTKKTSATRVATAVNKAIQGTWGRVTSQEQQQGDHRTYCMTFAGRPDLQLIVADIDGGVSLSLKTIDRKSVVLLRVTMPPVPQGADVLQGPTTFDPKSFAHLALPGGRADPELTLEQLLSRLKGARVSGGMTPELLFRALAPPPAAARSVAARSVAAPPAAQPARPVAAPPTTVSPLKAAVGLWADVALEVAVAVESRVGELSIEEGPSPLHAQGLRLSLSASGSESPGTLFVDFIPAGEGSDVNVVIQDSRRPGETFGFWGMRIDPRDPSSSLLIDRITGNTHAWDSTADGVVFGSLNFFARGFPLDQGAPLANVPADQRRGFSDPRLGLG